MKRILHRIIPLILIVCMLFGVVGCKSAHAGNIDDNDNWNSTDWDDITVSAFDDSEYLEDVIYDYCLFDMNINSIKSVDVDFVEQKDVSNYFDEDKIYENFKLNLDANKLMAKFAVGTGVIVICLALNVMTMGASQTVICIATGALNGAITGAASGAIIGGIIGGITSYLKNDGDFAETLSGAIDGAVDGYMWGAVCGAITGAFTQDYCFKAGTKVKTANGYEFVENIQVGDYVWSYNHTANETELKKVVNVFENTTTQLSTVVTENSIIEATPSHNFFINDNYQEIANALEGDMLFTYDQESIPIISNTVKDLDEVTVVYNFEVEDNHNYYVGDDEVLVHNRCINEEYADKTYNFESQLNKAQTTNDANDWNTYNSLIEKYPNGVKFVKDANGNVFPDFDEYSILNYKFEPVTAENLKAGTCLTGDSTAGSLDFKMFRQRMMDDGYTKQQISEMLSTYTIHHNPDMQTLQMIPRDLHQATRHTGGAYFIRLLKNLL